MRVVFDLADTIRCFSMSGERSARRRRSVPVPLSGAIWQIGAGCVMLKSVTSLVLRQDHIRAGRWRPRCSAEGEIVLVAWPNGVGRRLPCSDHVMVDPSAPPLAAGPRLLFGSPTLLPSPASAMSRRPAQISPRCRCGRIWMLGSEAGREVFGQGVELR